MKLVWSISGLLALGLALSGCSTSKLLNTFGGGEPAPQPTVSVSNGNTLALPPDLQLRAPGTIPAAAASTPAAPAETASLDPAPAPVAPVPPKDIYAEYGIAKVKPDGTAKTKEELQAELKVAITKRKQQQNPNYGTIFNLGNIFSDG